MEKTKKNNLALLFSGSQLTITVLVGVYLGQWLDEYYKCSPLLLIIFSCVFFSLGLYIFIKTANKAIKEDEIRNY